MSREIVAAHDALFVIDGEPGDYTVRPVGDPVARFDRKFEARHAILHDELVVDAVLLERLDERGPVPIDVFNALVGLVEGLLERVHLLEDAVLGEFDFPPATVDVPGPDRYEPNPKEPA